MAAPARGGDVSDDASAGQAPGGAFFYPETCHPPDLISRRRMLAAGVAVVGASLAPRAARAADNGEAIVRQWATSPDDPWAVCHGVRAMGRDFKMKSGQKAVDWLLETHLATVAVNGRTLLAFPLAVESHPNMFLKTMLEAGVPLDYGFSHQKKTRTLGEVVDDAHALFRPSQVMGQPNSLPWSIIAFARTTSPMRATWTNAWGESVDFDAVVDDALRLMEQASAPLAQAMRENRAESARAPVHGFTCGGAHMLYSLLTAAQTGFAGTQRHDRIRVQSDVMLWRLRADIALIERFYKERAAQPGAYWFELDAKVKLLGHGEECLAFAVRRGVVKLSEPQQKQRREAVLALKKLIADMEGKNVADAREINKELFRQLVGDTCHARRGLTLA